RLSPIIPCTATAPSARATLSLHDALPIFGRALEQPAEVLSCDHEHADGRRRRDRGRPDRRGCDERDLAEELSRSHLVDATAVLRSEEPRLNSSHEWISYAVFCLKKKKNIE